MVLLRNIRRAFWGEISAVLKFCQAFFSLRYSFLCWTEQPQQPSQLLSAQKEAQRTVCLQHLPGPTRLVSPRPFPSAFTALCWARRLSWRRFGYFKDPAGKLHQWFPKEARETCVAHRIWCTTDALVQEKTCLVGWSLGCKWAPRPVLFSGQKCIWLLVFLCWIEFKCKPLLFYGLFTVIPYIFRELLRRALEDTMHPFFPWHPTVRTQNEADEETCLSFCSASGRGNRPVFLQCRWALWRNQQDHSVVVKDHMLTGTEITDCPLPWSTALPSLGRLPLKPHSVQVCRILA